MKYSTRLYFNYLIMSEEEGEEKERTEKEKGKGKRGRPRERPEQGNCDITSIYQFFAIENDLLHGYDYRCVLCSARGIMGDGCLITKCVGPTNLLSHMKRVHHFVPTVATSTADEKRAFLGMAAIPKDKVCSCAHVLFT